MTTGNSSPQTCQARLSDGKRCLKPSGNSSRCRFHRHSTISDNQLNDLEWYIENTHIGLVDLGGMTFKGISFLTELLKQGKVYDFHNCVFEDCRFFSLDLASPQFSDCRFNNTQFYVVDFTGGRADFSNSSFRGDNPFFLACTFASHEATLFIGTRFRTDGNIMESCSISSENLIAQDVTIDSDVLRLGIYNGEWPTYDDTRIWISANHIDFSGLQFSGHFELINREGQIKVSPEILVAYINFDTMRSATFRQANLQHTRCAYSLIENVNFMNVLWPNGPSRRRILYDDLQREDWVELDEIRRLYVQLKTNHHNKMDYVRAGQWFYRETEIRKEMANKRLCGVDEIEQPTGWWRRRLCAIHDRVEVLTFSLYKGSTEYGSNYPRPLAMLLFVWLLSGILYMFMGFNLGTGREQLFFSPSCLDCWIPSVEKFVTFLRALSYSFLAMALQMGRAAKLVGPYAPIVYAIQLFLTFLLVPMLVFAVRQHFRR